MALSLLFYSFLTNHVSGKYQVFLTNSLLTLILRHDILRVSKAKTTQAISERTFYHEHE